MHTYWSDGRAFPDQAIAIYRDLGYDFLSLTDHNVFADQPDRWRSIHPNEGPWPGHASQAMFDDYRRRLGDQADIRSEGGTTQVRLKTYDELHRQFDRPGEFLLMPGMEITTRSDGPATRDVHMNYINLPAALPSVASSGMVHKIDPASHGLDAIQGFVREVAQLAAQFRRPYLMAMNHPFWRHYDIDPLELIQTPALRFFEVVNCGMTRPVAPDLEGYDPDRFWDIVNAFRSVQGDNLLLGLGSDDVHYYDEARRNQESGVAHHWIMVRARTLTPESLLAAMHAGDFYTSSGVFLDEVAFTASDRTLQLSVKPEPGVRYQVEFITTRRGFDPTRREMYLPAAPPQAQRTIPTYSPQIGVVAQRVEGVQACYRMRDDDLYVRARVRSDRPALHKGHNYPREQMAWTQPCA
jgi:hypothetical protein